MLFNNIEIAQIVLDYFIKKLGLYDYKWDVLTYIFSSRFNIKYNQIEELYALVQNARMLFIKLYGLYGDIIENVNQNILKFKFYDWGCGYD